MPGGLKETHNAMKKGRAYIKYQCNYEMPTETYGISTNNRKGELGIYE